MTINDLIKQNKLSRYKLSKISSVPYSTITDICNGTASLEKCSAETVYRLADALNVSMEDLILPDVDKRGSFELFKSNVCHRLKMLGDLDFLIELIEKDDIRKYYLKKWYLESFYLLGMLDYLCRVNELPICSRYDDLRKYKFEAPVYPSGIIIKSLVAKSNQVKHQALEDAIPEFAAFNIVENEVRNVI